MKTELTQARLRKLLHYDPETGLFTWIVPKTGVPRRKNGLAGSLSEHGYVRIKIDGRSYRAHRLAWLYVKGQWPIGEIDHKNRQRADNRLNNLRDVSFSVNQQNQGSPCKNNKVGLLGVCQLRDEKTFRAQIGAGGRHYYLGTYATADEAHAAYLATKRRLHEGCTI